MSRLAVSTAGASRAGHAAVPRCSTSDLVAWLPNGEGNGAAGGIFYSLSLTNISGHACTVFGFPGVSAVNTNGRRLGRPAHDSSPAIRRSIRRSGTSQMSATPTYSPQASHSCTKASGMASA